MKHRLILRVLAIVMCALFAVACFPAAVSAEEGNSLSLTEGEIRQGFVPAGTQCASTDSSVAWVDKEGNLNALKAGTTTVSDGTNEYSVTVEDYSDGSDTVGNLKILARYNDSMQFYDGHVYLLFTSYQDGVEVGVSDLYANYEISDQYYEDIAKDISAGSNHTGKDTDEYFMMTDDKSVTLNRGEIVTIGMYRDFDLSVSQAALGAITNSTAWSKLKAEGKTAIIKSIFTMLNAGKLDADEATAKLKAVFDEVGADYTQVLNGVVKGGVCFNRELFNQKLEWDQYENVTYNLDITRNQLRTLTAYLGGNLDKFSILKNSCATVALRAWNAAVGTRGGEPTAYRLSAEGDGIFALMDAPKGVRENIVKRLPGYYLNNAQGVAEPGAGYQDETGWVYVSAPKKVKTLEYTYEDNKYVFEEETSEMPLLITAACGGSTSYAADEQEVAVKINTSESDGYTTIEGADFTVNGNTYTLNGENLPETSFWIKTACDPPAIGEYFAADPEGNYFGTGYSDGYLSICLDSLPATFKIDCAEVEEYNTLNSVVTSADEVKATTEIYTKNGDEKKEVEDSQEIEPGTKIYVKSTIDSEEFTYFLNDIKMNDESFFDEEHYDAEEGAYVTTMPEGFNSLVVDYSEITLKSNARPPIQVFKGDNIYVPNFVTAEIYGETVGPEKIAWDVVSDPDNILKTEDVRIEAAAEGCAKIWAHANGNENIGVMLSVEVYDSADTMAKVTFDEAAKLAVLIAGDGEEAAVPYSGYLVKKGTELKFNPTQTDGTAILSLTANGSEIPAGKTVTVSEDTDIKVSYTKASVEGVPRKIVLDAEDNTYQLNAVVAYSGADSLKPIYDSSIRYESSDPLVTVDENGLITLAGDMPEDGAAVIVTAYAGSGNGKVYAQCKVIAGNYEGDRIVGRLTIHARRVNPGDWTPHGCATFTTYEDIDLDASYYIYNKPTAKYNELLLDYEKNPEKYNGTPALWNNNELNLENREEEYFDTDNRGTGSEPKTISLKAGESISVSNYAFDNTNLETSLAAFENSTVSMINPVAQELIRQAKKFADGEEIDGEAAFDSFVSTLIQVYGFSKLTGVNIADGKGSNGGLVLNREIFNQFRREYTQFPNNYYSVDITADELAALRSYLVNPDNNYYSLFVKNCATGAVDVWNTTLADRPELAIKGNLTGIGVDPMSLYYEIGNLKLKNVTDGEAGTNFCPVSVPFTDEIKSVIQNIADIGKVKDTEECGKKIAEAADAYNALNALQKERVWNRKALEEAKKKYDSFRADKKSKFDAYKAEKMVAALGLFKKGDSTACAKLIAGAEKAMLELKYDESKTPEENLAAIDNILTALAGELDKQRQSETEPTPPYDDSKDRFSAYKALSMIKALGLIKLGDSEACTKIFSDSEKALLELKYDENKTFEENKAAVDDILTKLAAALEDQRKAETEKEPEAEPTQPTTEPGTIAPSKVNFSKSPDLASAVNALKKAKSDADPKGSKFSKLKAKATKTSKTANKLTWLKVKGAKKYVVMGSKCGSKYHFKKLKTTTGTSFTQKKLKKNTFYKYVVLAVNSKNKVISASKVVHTATQGGKKTNYKSIKLSNTKKTLKKSKTYTLKITKKTKQNSKGKITTHRKIGYESANTKIATVTSKGKIKAVKKGTTYIYAYTQNGVYKRIKITVK